MRLSRDDLDADPGYCEIWCFHQPPLRALYDVLSTHLSDWGLDDLVSRVRSMVLEREWAEVGVYAGRRGFPNEQKYRSIQMTPNFREADDPAVEVVRRLVEDGVVLVEPHAVEVQAFVNRAELDAWIAARLLVVEPLRRG